MLPFFPAAFEHFDLAEYDVVISNTTGFAKGVITGPDTCHICYCHTPPRFAWRYHEYVSQGGFGRMARRVLPFMMHRLREWDLAAANRVDYFLSNSYNIERRVRTYYRRNSDILYPPVETDRFHIVENPAADYLLVLSRLVGYKRVSLAVEACTRLGLKLKVAGSGPDRQRLEAMAGPTVEFLGRVPDGQVESLMANCRAFIFPGEEDFGITPLEAMASGRPVVALRAGGAKETVLDGETGLFFDEPTAESLMDALQRLDTLEIDPQGNRTHAETFDLKRFQIRLSSLVEAKWEEHQHGYSHPTTGAIDRAKQPVPRKPHDRNGANGTGTDNGHDTQHSATTASIKLHGAS
jgi:glycosyltransferase involved in cell wall biosynthesis